MSVLFQERFRYIDAAQALFWHFFKYTDSFGQKYVLFPAFFCFFCQLHDMLHLLVCCTCNHRHSLYILLCAVPYSCKIFSAHTGKQADALPAPACPFLIPENRACFGCQPSVFFTIWINYS